MIDIRKVDSTVYGLHRYRQGILGLSRLYFFLIFSMLLMGCVGKTDLATVQDSGTTYYLSAMGSDNDAGTSPSEAWKSITKVNETIFKPGDRILFEGDHTFSGNLYLDAKNCPSSPENPIKISSYGEGSATIDGGTGTAIFVHNCGGVEISNLNLTGSLDQTILLDGDITYNFQCSGFDRENLNLPVPIRKINLQYGVLFYNDLDGDVKLEHVHMGGLDVSGFSDGGIAVVACNNRSGFRDIRIKNSNVHDNGDGGITVQGYFSKDLSGYSNEDVIVAGNKAYSNEGKPRKTNYHTGNGILISSVDGALIEHNVAYNNGGNNTWKLGGPGGIWAWDSNNVTIQFNESHHNKTSSIDGGGFGLDGGATNSVMQYNYSHDNDGGGYLVGQFYDARPLLNNVVRYNISVNDVRKGREAGILLFREGGTFEGLDIYNNTIYMTSTNAPKEPAPLKSFHSDIQRVRVINNLFLTEDGVPLISRSHSDADILFQGNNYYSHGSKFRILDSGVVYHSLDDWRAGTGQEMLGSVPIGMSIQPLLINLGNDGNILTQNSPNRPSSYQLQNASPMIDAGLDPRHLFKINPGDQDFYSNPIPLGKGYDIGAHEWTPTQVLNQGQ